MAISPQSFHQRQQASQAPPSRHTGNWFLNSKTYQEWKFEDKYNFLWLSGKPGCEKVVLSSTVISDLINSESITAQSVAYSYFDFHDDSKRTLENMLWSLVSQCYRNNPEACHVLDQVRETAQKAHLESPIICVQVFGLTAM
jgi:hypothetical protein